MLKGVLMYIFYGIGYLFVLLGYGKKVMELKKAEGEKHQGLVMLFGLLFMVLLSFGVVGIATKEPSALWISIGCIVIYLLWFIYARSQASRILQELEAEAAAKQAMKERWEKRMASLQIAPSNVSLYQNSADSEASANKVYAVAERGLRFDLQIHNMLPNTVTGFTCNLLIQRGKRSQVYPITITKQIPSGGTETVLDYRLKLQSVDYNVADTLLNSTDSAPTITVTATQIQF